MTGEFIEKKDFPCHSLSRDNYTCSGCIQLHESCAWCNLPVSEGKEGKERGVEAIVVDDNCFMSTMEYIEYLFIPSVDSVCSICRVI